MWYQPCPQYLTVHPGCPSHSLTHRPPLHHSHCRWWILQCGHCVVTVLGSVITVNASELTSAAPDGVVACKGKLSFYLGIDWIDYWTFGLYYQTLDNKTESWNPVSMIWLSSIWHYHLMISDSGMWKRLQNVYSEIKQTRLKPLSQTIWQPPPLHPFSYQPPTHRRLIVFPVCVIIIGEDSFVITIRQFGIHSSLQCDFQRLDHGPCLEIIMLFSSDLFSQHVYRF